MELFVKIIVQAMGMVVAILMLRHLFVQLKAEQARSDTTPKTKYKRAAKLKRQQAKRLRKLEKRLEAGKKSLSEEAAKIQTLRNVIVRFEELQDIQSVLDFVCKRSVWYYVQEDLKLLRNSPFRLWIKEWFSMKFKPWAFGVDNFMNLDFSGPTQVETREGGRGWDADESFQLARRYQTEEYEQRLNEFLAVESKLQQTVDELSQELELQSKDELGDPTPSVQVRVEVQETKREKLERMRRETDVLEQEILEEEQANNPSPHRRAAGIPRDEKSN